MSLYTDIDANGLETSSGVGVEYLDEDAIQNAIQQWIGSKRGDYLRNPGEGGFLDYSLFKTMNEGNLRILSFQLKNAFTTAFEIALEYMGAKFYPDYEHRILEIEITYRNRETDAVRTITIYVNAAYSYQRFSYEDIPFTDTNLLTFCTVKKPDMADQRLVYDIDDSYWKWGQYRFINFSQADPSFSAVLSMCNIGV